MANKYRSVLTAPGCSRLLSTALLGRLPQGMSALAVLLLVRDSTDSYAASGVAVGANALAAAAAAPVLGRMIDRVGRRWVVGPAALLQGMMYVLLAVAADAHADALVLIVCSAFAGALTPPIAPVVRTLLRDLFQEPSVRETAYALEAIAQETIWVVGPLLVTVIITTFSPKAAVLTLSVIGVLGTLLFLRSPLLDAVPEHRHGHRHAGSALGSIDLRWLLLPVTLMGVGLGAVEVGIPALALHNGSQAAAGYLLALWSLGSMAGGIRYSTTHWRAPLGSRYCMLLFLDCAVTIPLLAANSIAAAAVASFIAGLAVAPVFSCQYLLVGQVVVPGTEHEAFSWLLSGLIGGLAAGSALGGVAIGPLGVRAPFVIGCVAAAFAATSATRFRGRFSAGVALA